MQNISLGKKCKIDVIIGNDDGKLIDAWQKLWELVGEPNDEHEKIRKLLVNGGGVKLFLKCMEKFPGNTALLYTMAGCFSEVILDENLRPKMMNQDFAKHIINLADTPDFTDLSSCAMEVLCHMLKDGKASWRKTKLSFMDTLAKIDTIHDSWDISNVKTNLGTSNFESKFVFLSSDLLQLQHHGLWETACYTRQNNSTCIRIDLTHHVFFSKQCFARSSIGTIRWYL